MSLSLEEVRRAAALSKLRLTAAEEEAFAAQLGRVVEYIDQLKSFASAPGDSALGAGVEQEDVPHPDSRSELFLANAPEARSPFFSVPRMLAGGGSERSGARDE